LKDLGFRRRGRCWERCGQGDGGRATDLIQFELTVLKAAVRVKMYEMRWDATRRHGTLGTTTGQLEGIHEELLWNLTSAQEIPKLLVTITDRVERVTLPWFAAGGDPSTASESYSLEEFIEECG
jgi:hypothetical protein